jgi:hypothetical protein
MSEELRTAAKSYFEQEIPVVPVKQKKPLIEWAHWQTAHQTEEEFQSLPWKEADGFAVICGTKLYDGLFLGAIDFDVKNVGEEARERGKRTLKQLLTTQIEQTPSGGQHWIYHCQTKPRTISVYHDQCGLELLGTGKLCIMASSHGYTRINDNTPTIVQDLEESFHKALFNAGMKTEERTSKAV